MGALCNLRAHYQIKYDYWCSRHCQQILSNITTSTLIGEGNSQLIMNCLKIIWLSNLLTLSVPDEGYSRAALCEHNLTSAFVFETDWYIIHFYINE
jgi:hypothetical protein